MTRTELLKTVVAVMEVLDEALPVGDDAINDIAAADAVVRRVREALGAEEGVDVVHAAEDVGEKVREQAIELGQLRGYLQHKERDITALERRIADLLIEKDGAYADPLEVKRALRCRDDETLLQAARRMALEWDTVLDANLQLRCEMSAMKRNVAVDAENMNGVGDVGAALYRREDETLLQAAERNRDRIIELARQIDVQDAQLCGVLKVGPDKLFAETSRLVAYVKELEREIENLKDAAKEEGE